MRPDAERRPRREGGAQDAANVNARVTVTPLRRRRPAARRLPILATGHRDPLDGLAGPPIPDRPCARAVIGLDGRWRPCCRGAA